VLIYIKRLKVSEMTWILVGEDDVDSLYVEMELIVRISFKDIDRLLCV